MEAQFPRSRRDKRQGARTANRSIRVFVQLPEADKLQEGWIIDRSGRGMGLVLVVPEGAPTADIAPRGSVLTFKPTNAPRELPWTRIEVRHTNDGAGFTHVGGQLIDHIPHQHLGLFGHDDSRVEPIRKCTAWDHLEWTGVSRAANDADDRGNMSLAG